MKSLLLPIIALLTALHPAFAGATDAETLTFLETNAPEIHAKVAPLETSDPQDFRSAIDDAKVAAAEHTLLIAAGDPSTAAAYLKMYALDFAAISTADQFLRATDPTEKDRLTTKLNELISASYDQWTIVEQARVRRMEAELTKLKAELAKALADKPGVVKKDTAALIEESREYIKSKSK